MTPTPHPIKAEIKKAEITQLQLGFESGIAQPVISLMLSGWKPMDAETEDRLRRAIERIKKSQKN